MYLVCVENNYNFDTTKKLISCFQKSYANVKNSSALEIEAATTNI